MKIYYVKTPKENLQKLSRLKIKSIKEREGFLEFFTDRNGARAVSQFPDTTYCNNAKETLKTMMRKHIIALIGITLMILSLINQNVSVRSVRFTETDTYDEEVLAYLGQYYRHVGPFCYLNTDLNSINFDLRSAFYHYEWIGIRKSGAVLYVDIKKLANPPQTEDIAFGSLVAKTEGIIKEYHVTAGTVVIHEEQYVAAGDLLISGEITKYNNEIEYVRAKGYVIAETLSYKDYTIPKKTIGLMRTGRLEIIKAYYLCGRQINKNPSMFESYDVVPGPGRGGRLFSVQTFYRYEIKDVVTTYTKEDAVAYSKSLVSKEFRSEKTVDKEKILFIDLVRAEEDEDNYYIRLIVKSYQNIALFIPFS